MKEMEMVARGLYEVANAIRETGQLIYAAMMYPYRQGGESEEMPRYRCEKCGSPKWAPGGMGDGFRKCLDCGSIGDKIDAS